MGLITLVMAQDHLRDFEQANEADITRKIAQAESIIFDYLKVPTDTWPDSDGVPPLIEAATLLVLGGLYKEREGGDPISNAVQDILRRFRDPVLR